MEMQGHCAFFYTRDAMRMFLGTKGSCTNLSGENLEFFR